ncbi:MAG TPA: ABC transporter permease [Candidatus Limnocylindria bacterium]|nr:ABC transporter permease [Candidatus Limnocylindria bacterium]
MTAFLVRRLFITVVLIWLVTTVVFMFVRLLPGDPAMAILGAGETFQPTEAQLTTVRQRLGLDRSLPDQYASYLGGLVRGDLGSSLTSGRPVALDLGLRLGRTLQLMVPALLLSSFIGIAIGVLAARARGRLLDPVLSVIGLVGFSVPVFVIGNVMVLLLAIQLEWLPSSGYSEFTQDPLRSIRYMVMPTIALALAPLAVTMRMTRTTVVEELGLDYVRTARAKGLRERVLVYRHVLKNAMLPILAVIGLQVGAAFSGSVIVEYVFNWPGVGRLLLQAIDSRDYPVIQGTVLLLSTLFVIVNLITDLSYAYMNPRLRRR